MSPKLKHDDQGFLLGESIDLEPKVARFRAEQIQGELERYWSKRGHSLTLAELSRGLITGEIPLYLVYGPVSVPGTAQYRLTDDNDITALDAYCAAEKVRAYEGSFFPFNALTEAALMLDRLRRKKPAQAMADARHKGSLEDKMAVWKWCSINEYASAPKAAASIRETGITEASYRAIEGWVREYEARRKVIEWCKRNRAAYSTVAEAMRHLTIAATYRETAMDWIAEYDKGQR